MPPPHIPNNGKLSNNSCKLYVASCICEKAAHLKKPEKHYEERHHTKHS